MPAKKHIASSWTNKKIDNKLFFASIVIFLLISSVILYAYTSQSINKSSISIQVYFGTVYLNWKNSKPVVLPTTTPLSRPTLTPTPTPKTNPSIDTGIGEVKVSRSITELYAKINSPFVPLTEITDHATAQVLYDTIVALPPYPTPVKGALPQGSCPVAGKRVLYDLTFLNDENKPLHHAVVSMTVCGGSWYVDLDGSYRREFYSDMHLYVPFRALIASSLGLTINQLEGY